MVTGNVYVEMGIQTFLPFSIAQREKKKKGAYGNQLKSSMFEGEEIILDSCKNTVS